MGSPPCIFKTTEHGKFCYEIVCVNSRNSKFKPKLYHIGKDDIRTMVDAIEVKVMNIIHTTYRILMLDIMNVK